MKAAIYKGNSPQALTFFFPEVMRFILAFTASITFLRLCYPFLRTMGYPREDAFAHLDPFISKCCSSFNNSLFLYVASCVLIMSFGLIYDVLFYNKLKRFKGAVTLEVIIAVSVFFLSWSVQSKEFAFGIIFIRLLLSLGTYALFKKEILRTLWHPLEVWGQILPALVLVVWVFEFLRTQVLVSILNAWNAALIVGAVLLTVIVVILFNAEKIVKRKFRLIADVFILTGLLILTIRNDIHYLNYSSFLGPVNDVMLGKDILRDVVSTYGFLNIYFLVGTFKMLHVQDLYAGFAWVSSLSYFIGYGLVYLFFRFYSKSIVLSLLSLLVTLNICFYFHHIPVQWSPNAGFLRFGSFLPVLFLFLGREKLNKPKIWPWLMAFFVGASVFWVIDGGVWVLVSFFVTAFFVYFSSNDKNLKRDFCLASIYTGVVLLGFIALLTLLIYFKYNAWPVWEDMTYLHRIHMGGAGAAQLDHFRLWPLAGFTYLVAIFIALRKLNGLAFGSSWLFLSFFGMQWLLYYISEGILDNLARSCLPALLLSFVFISFVANGDWKLRFSFQAKNTTVRLKYPVFFMMIWALALSEVNIDKHGTQKNLLSILLENPKEVLINAQTDSLSKIMPEKMKKQFLYDIAGIQKRVGPSESLAVISKNDTLYFVQSKRKSFMKISAYPNTNFTVDDVPRMADNIIKSQIPFVFIDNSSYQCFNNEVSPHVGRVRELLKPYYQLDESLGFLDVLKRREMR